MSMPTIRSLLCEDVAAIQQICEQSPWVIMQFNVAEIEHLIATRPAVGAFDADGNLQAWILATTFTPPYAWLGGFGVPWHERQQAMSWLDVLLPAWYAALRARGVESIIYSGNDERNDWLRLPLLERGYDHLATLRAYDKLGTHIPVFGNQAFNIRTFDPLQDIPAILAIEALTFDPPWRFDAATLTEMATTYPFLVVAVTSDGELAGYQASLVEDAMGFFVRIAVHPRFQGQGVGARLMAAAMDFFAQRGVDRILLNAEETNAPAHRLYERWGFDLLEQRGFALWRSL